jgi:predicted aldo/keto reductase-like oxidoreductase
MMTTRRKFIKTVAGSGLALTLPTFSLFAEENRDRWGKIMPLKPLGSTGKKVTILGLGGFHVGRMDLKMASETVDLAMESGIRFFDTAESYQKGGSEETYGQVLTPKYRDEIFLMTKTRARDYEAAKEDLEGSLRRMKTDRLDLWLMHAINSVEDVENRLNNGVLDYMLKAKEEGKIKHLGFSGHTVTKAHLRLLELSGEPEACMMPINVIDRGYDSYIDNVLPVLKKKNIGVIAMKTLAGGSFFGRGFDGRKDAQETVMDHVSVNDAITYALSIPNDVLVTGPKTPAMLQEKIDIVNNFKKITPEEQHKLFAKVEHLAGNDVEYYKGIP